MVSSNPRSTNAYVGDALLYCRIWNVYDNNFADVRRAGGARLSAQATSHVALASNITGNALSVIPGADGFLRRESVAYTIFGLSD
jgi:hypothetical protein